MNAKDLFEELNCTYEIRYEENIKVVRVTNNEENLTYEFYFYKGEPTFYVHNANQVDISFWGKILIAINKQIQELIEEGKNE